MLPLIPDRYVHTVTLCSLIGLSEARC